jgi:UDP-4-amino-4,6-dideoxy-N-acetyl-beta-L-altrosamine N-acetyltransferase
MKDISLVKVNLQDIELIRGWRNSPEVSSYMYDESYISEEQQEAWFHKMDADPNSVYWIIEYNNKKLGLASLTNINQLLKSCYWAFYLGDTSVRGAGIGAKVEYNVLLYVFEELKLNKLRCEVLVNNDKVIKMHEKFGFRREAYYREHCFKNEKQIDVVGLAMLKSEWIFLKDGLTSKVYGSK